MRTALEKSASPSEKLDFIFSHIANIEFPDGRIRYSEGGIRSLDHSISGDSAAG